MGELTFEEIVEELYYDGWRSCEWIEFKAFVKLGTDLFTEIDEEVELPTWHALRAYQDEQRKKGEPVLLRTLSDDDKWRLNRNRYRTPNRTVYFGSYLETQDTQKDGPRRPYIKLYTASGADLGFFTNFRWKPGKEPRQIN